MNEIEIRNERHTTLFTVPDGGTIRVDEKDYRLEYNDPTHFFTIGPSGGRDCWHIDQFGDKVVGRGAWVQYTPPADQLHEEFPYYVDQEHGGWIEVPRALLKEVHIIYDISAGSRQKDDLVYLNDLGDFTRFRLAMKARGRRVKLLLFRVEGSSPIRSYQNYNRNE